MAADSLIAVPLPVDLVAALLKRFPGGISSVLADVAWDFLERTSEDVSEQKEGGIHWESVYLPNGTKVRTKYYGHYQEASISEGAIHWDGLTHPSMSQLASAMRGNTSNNAWKVLEVKRPNDTQWQLADYLRR